MGELAKLKVSSELYPANAMEKKSWNCYYWDKILKSKGAKGREEMYEYRTTLHKNQQLVKKNV